jgi:hypothetical protein
MVLDRQKSSATVVSAGTGYVDKMAAEMASIYGGEAEGAVRTLLDLAVEKLKGDTDSMVRADEAHLNETADDSAVLSERDEKAAVLRSVLVELRGGASAVYGADFVRKLGFKGETPSDPLALQTLGEQVLANLEGAATSPPAPARIGISMDLSAFKTPVTDALTPLGKALEGVAADKRDADQTLVAKQRAMEQYDLTFSTTANLISHMLRAAGETELAGKVRPSTRKPGQTIEDAQDPPSAE